MVALAWLLSRNEPGLPAQHHNSAPALVVESDRSHAPCPEGEKRRIEAPGGAVYEYCAHGLGLQRFVGTRLQGRVGEDAARRFFSRLFLAIGITFLAAFTVFKARFV